MKVTLSLTKAEAEAVMRAELRTGWGVKRTQALQVAEFKIREAIVKAQQESKP